MREPLLTIAIGRKGVGKTEETKKLLNECLLGNAYTGAKPQKGLIVDANDEFSHIKAIDLKDVGRFSVHPKIEIRRIRIWKNDNGTTRKMSLDEIADTLSVVLENYYGGTLLVEDPTKYISDSIPSDIIGHLCTQRHQSVDLILHFQTWGKICHPKIFGNLNFLRVHKCEDTVERHEAKFGGDSTHFKLAETLVNKRYYSGDRYFHCYVDKDRGKVRGDFSKEDFKMAIDSYLGEHYNIVKKELNRIDLDSGNKLYPDTKSVIEKLRSKYFEDYYGNPI